MRVTIRQIAEESGVSRGTVDRVLNNRGKVRPEVEERVRKVAEELGYKPNLLGRALIKMKENIKIGVILQDTGTPYLKTLSDGIKKAKGEVEDFGGTVIVKAVDYGNVEQTLAAMNKLKEAGIKGLVLMPINDKRVLQKIDQFTEEYGISVVTVNADVEDTKRICFVGQNSVQSGRAAAGLMHDILREEEGTIAVISGIETNTSLSDRIYGFCDEMKKISPKTEILDTKYCFEDDLIAAHLTESILNRYEDLSAIYITCHGEKGACDTLRKHKKMKKVTIIACDLSRQNYRYLKNGDIKYLIGQDGRYQGYEAVMTLYRLLFNDEPPKKEHKYTDIIVKTKYNI